MPRKFDLVVDGELAHAWLDKFTAEDLYGKRGREFVGENGEEFHKGYITSDGMTILESGCYKQNYLTESGIPLSYRGLVKYDDGKPLPFVESTYKKSNKLEDFDEIFLTELSLFSISRTYVLRTEDDSVLQDLKQRVRELYEDGLLLKSPYAYYRSQTPDEMILFPKWGEIVVFIGKMAEPVTGRKDEIIVEYDEEADEELGSGFGEW